MQLGYAREVVRVSKGQICLAIRSFTILDLPHSAMRPPALPDAAAAMLDASRIVI
jgi:hypothetical protein